MAAQNGVVGTNAMAFSNQNQISIHPGHYSDMQAMMENMEKLSETLQRNREEWHQVQEGLAKVERLQGRYARDGQLPALNGDAQLSDDSAPTITQLQQEIDSANSRMVDLETTYAEQIQLQEQYKDTLAQVTQLIQSYHENVQKHAAALHKHYGDLLQQSRQETIEAQMTHQEWQAGLKRYSETIREAFKAREEEGRPYKARIAALKEENRMLRMEVGWDPPVDSDEDEWDEEEAIPEGSRGRGSRGSQPVAGPGDRQGGLILPFTGGAGRSGGDEERQSLSYNAAAS